MAVPTPTNANSRLAGAGTINRPGAFANYAPLSAQMDRGEFDTRLGAALDQERQNNQAALARQNREHAFNLASQGFDKAMGAFGGGAPGGPVGDDAFEAMEYGKAKSKIGQNKLGALQSFRDQLAGRGMLGSTLETTGQGNIIATGQDELGDVALDQARSNITRHRQVEDRNFAAAQRQREIALNSFANAFNMGGGY